MPPAEHPERELLRLVHHHPGRLRLRGSALRQASRTADPAQGDDVDRLCTSLSAMSGISRVAHSGHTGSLLIEYEPAQVELPTILGGLLAAGFAVAEPVEGNHADPADAIFEAARKANAVTKELTGGRADLKVLFPAALASAAAVQFIRSPVPMRWDNLLYWSYQFFVGLNAKKPGDVEREEEKR